MILQDTNAVIELLQEKQYEEGRITIMTLIEILRGIEEERRTEIRELLEESFRVINIDNEVVKTYCTLHNKLREKGETIPDADLLIAATSLSHELTLKTADKHFERLKEPGLKTIPIQ